MMGNRASKCFFHNEINSVAQIVSEHEDFEKLTLVIYANQLLLIRILSFLLSLSPSGFFTPDGYGSVSSTPLIFFFIFLLLH